MRDSWSQRAEADGVLGFGADDRHVLNAQFDIHIRLLVLPSL